MASTPLSPQSDTAAHQMLREASTVLEKIENLLPILDGMHQARRACETLTFPTHAVADHARSAVNKFDEFSARFYSGATKGDPSPFVKALQYTGTELVLAINNGTREFIYDCLKLLSPARRALEEGCKVGWPPDMLNDFMSGPLKIVHQMSFKASRDGSLSVADLQTLLDLIPEAQKLHHKVTTLYAEHAKRRSLVDDLRNRIAVASLQISTAMEILEKASETCSATWKGEISNHNKARERLAEAIEKTNQLSRLVVPGQTDWTEFDASANEAKATIRRARQCIGLIKKKPQLHLSVADSYNIAGRAEKVRMMSVHCQEVAYWWRKLRAITNAFERFAAQPKPTWPSTNKVWRLLRKLDFMEATINEASRGDTDALEALPEVIVFHNMAFLEPFLLPEK